MIKSHYTRVHKDSVTVEVGFGPLPTPSPPGSDAETLHTRSPSIQNNRLDPNPDSKMAKGDAPQSASEVPAMGYATSGSSVLGELAANGEPVPVPDRTPETIANTIPVPPTTTGPNNIVRGPPPIARLTPVPRTRTGVDQFIRRTPPAPLSRSLLNGKSAQMNSGSRRKCSITTKDLISKYSGCFACRIVTPDHGPCHEDCGTSGMSSCAKDPHIPFSCTSLGHEFGWIQWRKQFIPPGDVRRCFFCWLPDDILVTGQHKAELPSNTKCRYADSMVVAAWHILNMPDLLGAVGQELGFIPGPDLPGSFAIWLMGYGSESEDLRLFSVFSWLCKRFYPVEHM